MKKQLLHLIAIFMVYQSYGQAWTELDTLTGSDAYHMDNFGSCIKLSTDGSTAIVTAPRSIVSPFADHGKAYILVRSGNSWNEQKIIIPADGQTGSWFGGSADISADGNTVVIGAHLFKVNGIPQGKFYIYNRTGTAWTKQAEFINPVGVQLDAFGSSVSISGDGNTVLAGSKKTTDGSASASVHVYTRSGSQWSYSSSLKSADQTNGDEYASAIDISKDGNTAIVGATKKNSGGMIGVGKVYVYTRSGIVWTEQKSWSRPDSTNYDAFGQSVVLSADGNTAVIGASGKTVNKLMNHGSAIVYIRTGTNWTEQAVILPSDGVKNNYFGYHMSLSDDGNTLVTGTDHRDVGPNLHQGKAYTYTRTGTSWTAHPHLFASDPVAGDYFGTPGLSGDGKVLAVGAALKSLKFDFQGKLYFYKNDLVTGMSDATMAPDAISVYPNPAKDLIHINSTIRGFAEIEIASIDGHLIEKGTIENASSFDFNLQVAPGIYLLKLKSSSGAIATYKVVKQL